MLRALGCLLLIFTGAGAGRLYSERLEHRCRTLCALTEMSSELTVMIEGYMTTSEMLSLLSSGDKYRELTFLNCDITKPSGRTELEAQVQALDISSDIKVRLISYFDELGSSDMQREKLKAELLHAYLAEVKDDFRERYHSDKRLARALGLLSGAFAAVLLI